jgi:hypothetical protein
MEEKRMRLAQVPNRLAQMAEDCEVTERLTDASKRLGQFSEKAYDRMSVAGDAARRGALVAYRTALEHPKTSIGGLIIAAAVVGGILWYVFGDRGQAAPRRRPRVRAKTERRKQPRQARAAAA